MPNLARTLDHAEFSELFDTARSVAKAPRSRKSTPPLLCVIMDDNDLDRKAIGRLAEKSRHNLHIFETATIAETRKLLAHQSADLLFADNRVPDGNGIEFAHSVIRQGASAPRVIVVTGEQDTNTAIEALRAGASDYLPKDEMTLDLFDGAIDNALRPYGRAPKPEHLPRSEVVGELTSLRDISLRNMRHLKASILPLIANGWKASQGKSFDAAERAALTQEIQEAARRIPALIDEVVVSARCGNADTGFETVDPVAILQDIAADDTGVVHVANAKLTFGQLPKLQACPRRLRLLFEALIQASIQFCPLGQRPEISIGAARDPSGQPIIWLRDNGVSLKVRKHSFGNNLAQSSLSRDRSDPFIWSLCQHVAETLGGELRIKDGPQDRTTVMLRFAKS